MPSGLGGTAGRTEHTVAQPVLTLLHHNPSLSKTPASVHPPGQCVARRQTEGQTGLEDSP